MTKGKLSHRFGGSLDNNDEGKKRQGRDGDPASL
jgi:hypothetical protein